MAQNQPIKNKNSEEDKTKVWADKDGTVHIKVTEVAAEQDVYKLIKEAREVIEKLSGKAKILIDISGAAVFRSAPFRKKAAEQVGDIAKNIGFKRAAMFGGGLIRRTVASFVIAASGIKNMRIFETKEEALKWLKYS